MSFGNIFSANFLRQKQDFPFCELILQVFSLLRTQILFANGESAPQQGSFSVLWKKLPFVPGDFSIFSLNR